MIEDATGASAVEVRRVTGGDIAASFRVEIEGCDAVFVKEYDAECVGIGEAEARGLTWLSEATELRIPDVLACGPSWLALEWIESGSPSHDFADKLGRGLANLHTASAPEFGWAVALSTQVHQMPTTGIVHSHAIGASIEDGDPPIRKSADPGHPAQKIFLVAFHLPDDNLRFT